MSNSCSIEKVGTASIIRIVKQTHGSAQFGVLYAAAPIPGAIDSSKDKKFAVGHSPGALSSSAEAAAAEILYIVKQEALSRHSDAVCHVFLVLVVVVVVRRHSDKKPVNEVLVSHLVWTLFIYGRISRIFLVISEIDNMSSILLRASMRIPVPAHYVINLDHTIRQVLL